MEFIKRKKIIYLLFLSLILLGFAQPAKAQLDLSQGLSDFLEIAPLPDTPLPIIIGNIVRVIIGFTGLIAVIIIIIGGLKWMTSGGNPEKISSAKKLMLAGLIGLLIIILSYTLVSFALGLLKKALGIEEREAEISSSAIPDIVNPASRYLTVTSKAPKPEQVVFQNTKIIVSFSQRIQEQSVRLEKQGCENPTFSVRSIPSGSLVAGSIRVVNNTIIFTPLSPCPQPLDKDSCQQRSESDCNIELSNTQCCGCFQPGEYEVVLTGGEEGILGTRTYGNTLNGDVSWMFTVEEGVDDNPLQIESVLPLPDSQVARNAGIIVNFNQGVDLTTLKLYNPACSLENSTCDYQSCGQDSCQSWAVNNINEATIRISSNGEYLRGYFEKLSPYSFVFRPTSFCPKPASDCRCFEENALIQVEISEDIKGSNCQSLDCSNSDYCSFSFQTSDQIDIQGPKIKEVIPFDGANDVDRISNIAVIFDEAIDPTSVNEDTFQVSDMIAREISASLDRAIYKPYQLLTAGKKYRAVIYGGGKKGHTCDLSPDFALGIRDIYGNSLEENFYKWSFSVINQINQNQPYIDWVNPTSGAPGQCITIHGYNLGCCPNGECSGNKKAKEYAWDYLAGVCEIGTELGKVEYLSKQGDWKELNSENILLWKEINRDCPDGGCPPDYQPENLLVIRAPEDIKKAENNFKITPAISGAAVVEAFNASEEWEIGITGSDVVVDKELGGIRIAGYIPTTPFLWIANSNLDKVSKISTETGELIGRYQVGDNPSRTTVDMNGDPWIANRSDGTIVKLDGQTGEILKKCVLNNSSSGPRGVAVDKQGNVWAGTYYGSPQLFKIPGDDENCTPLKTCTLPSGGVYGLAIDRQGYLWVSNRRAGAIDKVDPETCEVTRYGPISSAYGIAIDLKGDVWVAHWADSGGIYRVNPNENALSYYNYGTSYSYPRGVAVDKQGNVWATLWAEDKVIKIDSNTGQIIGTYQVGDGPIGITGDAENNIWVVNYYGGGPNLPSGGCQGGTVTKLKAETGEAIGTYCIGDGTDIPRPYTYSDMAGYLLRFVTNQSATWQTTVDAGKIVEWHSIIWKGEKPEGSSLSMRFKVDEGSWGEEYYEINPSQDFSLSFLPPGQYLGIEIKFEASPNGESPVVSELFVRTKD